jgi:hypothetical protein
VTTFKRDSKEFHVAFVACAGGISSAQKWGRMPVPNIATSLIVKCDVDAVKEGNQGSLFLL